MVSLSGIHRGRFVPLLLPVLVASSAVAQTTDNESRAGDATVEGVVYDSIARMPLAGATVQLVGMDSLASFIRTVQADSLGRFAVGEVPTGRFMLGFFHPLLDSLGLDAPVRKVQVDDRERVRVDLAIPSPERLAAAICGPASPGGSGSSVVIGVVRDARDRAPVPAVTVWGEWLELSLGSDGFRRRIARARATTDQRGRFALCDVPMPGAMVLVAGRGADSTGTIEVQIPDDGFLRRDLYLARSDADASGSTPRRGSAGSRLTGRVVSAVEGGPVAGARVSIDGEQTSTNDQGEWMLAAAPLGTRTLAIRAVGFYPEVKAVDVVLGTAPIRTTLSTMAAVLDTVRVTASRPADRHVSGFAERRRSGAGRYLTSGDIARRNPIRTADIFRTVSSVTTENGIKMRGPFGDCSPALYIDGRYIPPPPGGLTDDDINDWVGNPQAIAGVEIYSEAAVPPQFQPGLKACGSIVIWTK